MANSAHVFICKYCNESKSRVRTIAFFSDGELRESLEFDLAGTSCEKVMILMDAFSDSFLVAAEGTIYTAGLSYNVPVSWGPISKLTFYDDYSILDKGERDFEDSQINTVGCMVTAGPVYTYIDFISGKNAKYLGDHDDSFGAGDKDADLGTKFNINIAYYF